MITDQELEAISRRSSRFMARLAGEQEGSVALAAQMSAVDVPNLLAEVERLRADAKPADPSAAPCTCKDFVNLGHDGTCPRHS